MVECLQDARLRWWRAASAFSYYHTRAQETKTLAIAHIWLSHSLIRSADWVYWSFMHNVSFVCNISHIEHTNYISHTCNVNQQQQQQKTKTTKKIMWDTTRYRAINVFFTRVRVFAISDDDHKISLSSCAQWMRERARERDKQSACIAHMWRCVDVNSYLYYCFIRAFYDCRRHRPPSSFLSTPSFSQSILFLFWSVISFRQKESHFQFNLIRKYLRRWYFSLFFLAIWRYLYISQEEEDVEESETEKEREQNRTSADLS